MKIALIVGHHPYEGGAVSHDGTNEFDFYDDVYDGDLTDPHDGVVDDIIAMYPGPHRLVKVVRETRSMPVFQINQLAPTFFVSFHANAAESKEATGTEVLYCSASEKSKSLAKVFAVHIRNSLGLTLRHGDGLLSRDKFDRGAALLWKTTMPGVLLEPFFISNPNDWKTVKDNYDNFVSSMMQAIIECAKIAETW